MRSRSLLQQLWHLVEPILLSRGMELVELEFQREPGGWVLRLYVDQEGGVTLEDCAAVSREVGDLLDVKDPIDHPYRLEVSSPGLDRPIRRPKDFQRFAGHKIRIRLSASRGGRRVIQGILLGIEGNMIKMDSDGGVWEVPLEEISKARLVHNWEDTIGQGAG